MSAIDELWAAGKLPIRNALHFAGDGGSYDVVLDEDAPGGLRILDAFEVGKMLSEAPHWVTVINGLTERAVPGRDSLWAGETSYGSDGFIARVREDESLVWAVLFQDSNPFEDAIELNGRYATFNSTSDVAITLDVDDPRLTVTPHRHADED